MTLSSVQGPAQKDKQVAVTVISMFQEAYLSEILSLQTANGLTQKLFWTVNLDYGSKFSFLPCHV
jgi:hypothetical protein